MRIYYSPSGRRRGYSMSGGQVFGVWLLKAVLLITFLIWPLAAASNVHGHIALWGWIAEVVWLGLLAVACAVVAAPRGERQ